MTASRQPQERRRFVALIVTAVVLLGIFDWWYLSSDPPRYLVIHADDAGMYPSVNRATIEAMEKGLVSSCSVMAVGPAFDEFAASCRDHPERDVGVHLALTCDTESQRWGPVLPKTEVPSLLDPDGFLWSTTGDVASHARIDEVERELRAQIEKAQKAGIEVTHLDHHMFVLYRRADFLRLYVRLAIEFDVPIRYARDVPRLIGSRDESEELLKAYEDGLETLNRHRLPVFDAIDSDNYFVPAAEKQTYYINLIRRLPPGVSEIVMHCDYGPPGPGRAPHADLREADLRAFTSDEIKRVLEEENVRVITWREHRRRFGR